MKKMKKILKTPKLQRYSKDPKKEIFMKNFTHFQEIILKETNTEKLINNSNLTEHLKNLHSYNILDGKMIRGLSVLDILYHIKKKPTEKDILKSSLLGWCIEAVFFIIINK
jgi:hypothetical protein